MRVRVEVGVRVRVRLGLRYLRRRLDPPSRQADLADLPDLRVDLGGDLEAELREQPGGGLGLGFRVRVRVRVRPRWEQRLGARAIVVENGVRAWPRPRHPVGQKCDS